MTLVLTSALLEVPLAARVLRQCCWHSHTELFGNLCVVMSRRRQGGGWLLPNILICTHTRHVHTRAAGRQTRKGRRVLQRPLRQGISAVTDISQPLATRT
jgi:hypothetical protein